MHIHARGELRVAVPEDALRDREQRTVAGHARGRRMPQLVQIERAAVGVDALDVGGDEQGSLVSTLSAVVICSTNTPGFFAT